MRASPRHLLLLPAAARMVSTSSAMLSLLPAHCARSKCRLRLRQGAARGGPAVSAERRCRPGWWH
jgi:hypothetical protein